MNSRAVIFSAVILIFSAFIFCTACFAQQQQQSEIKQAGDRLQEIESVQNQTIDQDQSQAIQDLEQAVEKLDKEIAVLEEKIADEADQQSELIDQEQAAAKQQSDLKNEQQAAEVRQIEEQMKKEKINQE